MVVIEDGQINGVDGSREVAVPESVAVRSPEIVKEQ